VLVVGATVIFLTLLNYRNLILPSLIPLLTFLFFHIYDKSRDWLAVVAAPLEIPVVIISVSILKLFGIGAYSVENVIMFTTRNMELMQIPIVFDCTGVESMGAYLLTTGIIFYYFKKMPSNRKILFLILGIVGTYLANILRVVAICMSGYYYGYGGTTQLAHVHLGWIIFAIWMFVYWTAFFISYRKFENASAKKFKKKGIY
jgi:exosortase